MKKILIVAEFSYFGGARSFFETLLRFYANENIEIAVALTREQLTPDVARLLSDCGADYFLIKARKEGLLRLWYRFPFSVVFDIFSLLRVVMKTRPSMIFVSNAFPGLFLGALAFPLPCIYFLHAYPVHVEPKTLKGGIRQIAQRWFLDRRVKHGRLIATVSEDSKRRIGIAWGSVRVSESIRVIPNTSLLKRDDVEAARSGPQGRVRILTLGLVAWSKNPKLWIDVAERVCRSAASIEIEFIWAGGGDELKECQAEVEARGLGEQVRFIGFKDDVAALYTSADIYFQPSVLESQGLAVLDAMSVGIPCVVSNAGGLPESVEDGETGFVVSLDAPAAMAARIVELASDAELRKRFGHAAVARYERQFGYEVWASRMRSLHAEVTGAGELKRRGQIGA